MRIMFIIASMGTGGAERQAALLCNAWSEMGHEVILRTVERGGSQYPLVPSVKLLPLREAGTAVRGLAMQWRDLAAIRRAVRESAPDVVVSFIEDLNFKVLLATLLLPPPVLVSERAIPPDVMAGRVSSARDVIVRLLRALLYPRANTFIAQSRAAAAWARQAGLNRRIAVVPNAVAGFSECEGARRETTILVVGRMTRQKGFDLAISAFAALAARHPDWKLRFIGDGPLRRDLETMVQDAGLSGRVQFAGIKTIDAEDYSRAGIFLLPSRFEGFPNVLIEAMSCGCPVLASDCPFSNREIVADGEDGLLFRSEDAADLCTKLEVLIEDAELRRGIGRQAKIAAMRYRFDRVGDIWDEVLKTATHRAARGRVPAGAATDGSMSDKR